MDECHSRVSGSSTETASHRYDTTISAVRPEYNLETAVAVFGHLLYYTSVASDIGADELFENLIATYLLYKTVVAVKWSFALEWEVHVVGSRKG